MIHEQALLAVTGELAVGFGSEQGTLKSPGLLRKHYSPRARVTIMSWSDDEDLWKQLAHHRITLTAFHVISHTHVPSGEVFSRVSVIPHDPEAFARAIYAELHECDEAGSEAIVIEGLPETNEWRAIADRLRRAAAA